MRSRLIPGDREWVRIWLDLYQCRRPCHERGPRGHLCFFKEMHDGGHSWERNSED